MGEGGGEAQKTAKNEGGPEDKGRQVRQNQAKPGGGVENGRKKRMVPPLALQGGGLGGGYLR